MSTVTIEIPALGAIKEGFRTAPARIRAELAAALRYSAMLTQRTEKEEAPIDRGYLRGSIDTRVNSDSAVIWPRANYAAAVNDGTGIYGPKHQRIYPKNGKVLAWKSGGKTIFARSIAGQKPNPFRDRTVARVTPQVMESFSKAADNVIKGK